MNPRVVLQTGLRISPSKQQQLDIAPQTDT